MHIKVIYGLISQFGIYESITIETNASAFSDAFSFAYTTKQSAGLNKLKPDLQVQIYNPLIKDHKRSSRNIR
ncbi:hypothetical protein BLOT_002227 [Blomia tropicalis]|nr:hypothetical protein BLOT_002227 [Blomia tropicalis]